MRQHLNTTTLLSGGVLCCIHIGTLPLWAVGAAVIACELSRAYRIERATADVPAETVAAFYGADRAHRYFGAAATARRIRQSAVGQAVPDASTGSTAEIDPTSGTA